MVSEQARFIQTNDLFSLAFFDFYPQNATGRGLLFSRTCSPNIFIEKLFSALPAAGGQPKRNFGKSSHKPCPVMLASERKCRKSSHKARVQDVCANVKTERGHVRSGEGKEFSGKVSIVMRTPRRLCRRRIAYTSFFHISGHFICLFSGHFSCPPTLFG